MNRPESNSNEYNPFYETYVSKIGDGEITAILENQKKEWEKILLGIPDEKWDYKYGEDKWSIRQLVMHVIDAERVFAMRALCISRGEKQNLFGFDQDEYMANTDYSHRKKEDIVSELIVVRNGSTHLFKNMTEQQTEMLGTASEHSVSVRGLAYIIAGHAEHHLRILKERYLS
jgi:uncharacterized damage-inducible protein DinB